jgi:hypothetical protein
LLENQYRERQLAIARGSEWFNKRSAVTYPNKTLLMSPTISSLKHRLACVLALVALFADYSEIVALLHEYVALDPQSIEGAADAGGVSIQPSTIRLEQVLRHRNRCRETRLDS